MLTHPRELEADRRPRLLRRDGHVQGRRQEGSFADAFGFRDAAVDGQGGSAAQGSQDILRPCGRVINEEVGAVGGEMAEPEGRVGHAELARGEVFVVRLAPAGDVARAPAGVDEFPVLVVDLDGIPGVTGGVFGG